MGFHFHQLWARLKERPWSAIWELPSLALFFVSGEFLLCWFANSGAVILARALWASFFALTIAFWANSIIDIGWSGKFDPFMFIGEFRSHGVWYAYVFAAIYTALYTRFMAQWRYMGDLYNSLMAKTIDQGEISKDKIQLVMWWAAFIEDAEVMHLETKESYAGPIKSLLEDANNGVRDEYVNGRSEEHLKHLASRLGLKLTSTEK